MLGRNGVLRKIINGQIWLSYRFDRILPECYRIDGNQDFLHSFAPKFLQPNLKIYDVGGGQWPYISEKVKAELQLKVCGLDIDQNELNKAPAGAYDEVICTDITKYEGKEDADFVICQAVLEHVRDVDRAFAAIASILKPGGRAAIFVPSRNAVYARLNLLLPQNFKKKMLYAIYPHQVGGGFPSFYNRCTPREFEDLARHHGLVVEEKRYYFTSDYFAFFFPAHVIWRLWVLMFRFIARNQAAETFCMAFRKDSAATPSSQRNP
jgi:2-polyprenyl-6-hydroxyphenyl methylase/3-demethylubiquinone-9 3-methyltransferase